MPNQSATESSFSQRYGFDQGKIRRRLAFLGLSRADYPLADLLHEQVIKPALDAIVDRFYQVLLEQPESRDILDRDDKVAHLRDLQKTYLLSLGRYFDQDDYCEHRLRVGVAHARGGVPLSIYLCAYRLLDQIIIDMFPAAIRDDPALNRALVEFLLKVTALDMSLAVETYHISQVSDLEQAVERLHRQEQQLRQLAGLDALTGLINHENALRRLEDALEASRLRKQPLCVIMADLDHFKRINGTHGHQIGDEVLREAAARLAAAVREPDIIGRYGGEEFIVGLVNTAPDTARVIGERIRRRIADTPINSQGTMVTLTISLGLATLQEDDTLRALIKRADAALYDAKAQGRNRLVTA